MTMGSCYHIDNLKGVHLTCHRRLLTSVVSLTALAAHYTTVLMAQEKEKAFWTEPEVTALVDYLHEHQSECAEGGNFKIIHSMELQRLSHLRGHRSTSTMLLTSIVNNLESTSGTLSMVQTFRGKQRQQCLVRMSSKSPILQCVHSETVDGYILSRCRRFTSPSTNDEPDVNAAGVQAPGPSSSMSGDVIMSGANAPPPLSMPPLSGAPIMSGINAPPPLSMTPLCHIPYF
ncbi:hypothetical protein BDR07DRAFT_1497394 [Suillus spraguei]|nr:hypothetical protein BDR07DRAFT_1497394 [Suillus spraguei]